MQNRHFALRAYCPKIYTVLSKQKRPKICTYFDPMLAAGSHQDCRSVRKMVFPKKGPKTKRKGGADFGS
jgi:hypothetical protein